STRTPLQACYGWWRGGFIRGKAFPERGDLAPLAEELSDQREDAEQRAGDEEAEQHQDERRLQHHVEVEAQRDRLGVLGRERDQQQEYDQPYRPGDEAHGAAAAGAALTDRLRSALARGCGGLLGRLVD